MGQRVNQTLPVWHVQVFDDNLRNHIVVAQEMPDPAFRTLFASHPLLSIGTLLFGLEAALAAAIPTWRPHLNRLPNPRIG